MFYKKGYITAITVKKIKNCFILYLYEGQARLDFEKKMRDDID